MREYSWLAEKKSEAMKRKLVQRGVPSYRQLPIGERYGASFTGYGPDGKLDRNAVAGIETDAAGRQHAYHEGEAKIDMPEGSLYINSDMMNMAGPQTQQDQSEMNLYAKRGNLPGFLAGGFTPGVPPMVDKNPFAEQKARNLAIDMMNKVGKIPEKIPELKAQDAAKNVVSKAISYLPGQQAELNAQFVAQNTMIDIPKKLPGYQAPDESTQRGSTDFALNRVEPADQIIMPGRQAPWGTSTTAEFKPIEVTPPEKQIIMPGRQAPSGEPTTVEFKPVEGTLPAETANADVPPPGTTPAAGTTKTPPTAMELEAKRATDEQSLRQQQERSALEQRLIQQGVDPSRARLEGQLLANRQESELAGTAAKYGIANAQAKQEDEKYKDTQDWKSYEAAIAAGDFTTAASAYQRVTGNPISMDQMRTYQNYMNTKQQQDITTGALGIQSLTTRVGAEKVTAVSDAIGKGMSLSQINTQYPDLKLTADEFKSMYENTPAGERNWNRDMAYAQTLIEAGGPDNITNAAKIYNDRFPGTGIDFSGIITKDKAKTFNQGLSQLSSYVAAGMDYDEAIAAMNADGTFKMLGMDKPGDVERLYKGLKVNAIDEQWDTISKSEWYNSDALTDADRKDMQTFFGAVLSGKLDYSIQKEYTVTSADGKTTQTMTMSDKAAAGYATSNPGSKIIATGKEVVVPRATVTDANAETPLKPGQTKVGDKVITTPTGKKLGEVFLGEDGNLYTVGENTTPTPVDFADMTTTQKTQAFDALKGKPLDDQLLKQLTESYPHMSVQITTKDGVWRPLPDVGSVSKYYNPITGGQALGKMISKTPNEFIVETSDGKRYGYETFQGYTWVYDLKPGATVIDHSAHHVEFHDQG